MRISRIFLGIARRRGGGTEFEAAPKPRSRPRRLAMPGLALVLVSSTATTAAPSSAPPIVWHLHDIKGYLFVDGSVDGTPGLFMLDTGTPFRVLLNRHCVQLGTGTAVAGASAGSGQALAIQSHGVGHKMSIDGHTFSASSGSVLKGAEPDEALSADFDFIEQNITPHYLGMIGYGLIKDYYMILDYQAGTATLQPIEGGAPPPTLGGGPVVSVAFRPTVRPMPPGPPFLLTVGGVAFPTTIDTGGGDEIEAPASMWSRIMAARGVASTSAGDGAQCVVPVAHTAQGQALTFPAVEKIVGDHVHFSLSYRVLRHYRTLWDPVRGTVGFQRLVDVPAASARPCA